MSRVEHHAGLASGSEHAHRLSDRLAVCRRVVQHAPRVDAVKGAVVEGKGLRVGGSNLRTEPFERQAPPDELDRVLGQVDAGRDCSCADEADEVGPEPDADLEQLLAASSLEVREPCDVRVELVPRPLDLGEELGVPSGGATCSDAAGLFLPKAPDALLLIRCGRRRGHRLGLYYERAAIDPRGRRRRPGRAPAAGVPRNASARARAARRAARRERRGRTSPETRSPSSGAGRSPPR